MGPLNLELETQHKQKTKNSVCLSIFTVDQFIPHEGGGIQLKAGAAAGDRAAQHDWLHALWKLSLEGEEEKKKSE